MKKYRVYIVESERGWGWKIEDFHDYDTLEAALAFQKSFNQSNIDDYARTKEVPDWYMQAEMPVEVENS